MKKIFQQIKKISLLFLIVAPLVACSVESNTKVEGDQNDPNVSLGTLSVTAGDVNNQKNTETEDQEQATDKNQPINNLNQSDPASNSVPKNSEPSQPSNSQKDLKQKSEKSDSKVKAKNEAPTGEMDEAAIQAEANKCIKEGGLYNTFARQCFKK